MSTNNYAKQYETLNEIPDLEYIGYVWGSDKESYEVVKGSFSDFKEKYKINPFIVEGYLRSTDEKTAVVMKHIGDSKLVMVYDLERMKRDKIECDEIKMVAVKGDEEVKYVVFEQYWNEEDDPNCEEMKVLVPMVSLFKEFSN